MYAESSLKVSLCQTRGEAKKAIRAKKTKQLFASFALFVPVASLFKTGKVERFARSLHLLFMVVSQVLPGGQVEQSERSA
jgi:hypothetical protein